MTIADSLTQATSYLKSHAIADAEASAKALLAATLSVNFSRLASWLEHQLTPRAYQHYQTMLARRSKHEPVAYITGRTEFCGLPIAVNRHVLIPRAETEQLVELVMSSLTWRSVPARSAGGEDRALGSDNAPDRGSDSRSECHSVKNDKITLVDVGTGSGAIALALAHQLKNYNIQIIATDISKDALTLAKQNAKRLQLDSYIQFIQADLLSQSVILSYAKDLSTGLRPPLGGDSHVVRQGGLLRMTKAENLLLVANLPYVPHARLKELAVDIRAYEPLTALDGGPDGLDYYRKLFAQIAAWSAKPQAIFCEIDETQGQLMRSLIQRYWPQAEITIEKDLAGFDRFITTFHPA